MSSTRTSHPSLQNWPHSPDLSVDPDLAVRSRSGRTPPTNVVRLLQLRLPPLAYLVCSNSNHPPYPVSENVYLIDVDLWKSKKLKSVEHGGVEAWKTDKNSQQLDKNGLCILSAEARIDLNMNEINKEVVKKVWDRIAPGLDSQFDSIYSVPTIAPRPLLLLNGADDPRCSVAGLDVPMSRTQKTYQKFGCPENFEFIAQTGIGHEMTTEMVKEASDWFDKLLCESIKE